MGDFHDYVTQEVVVPQEPEHEEEPIQEETLVDTTDNSAHENQISIAIHQKILQEKDFLNTECEKLRFF